MIQLQKFRTLAVLLVLGHLDNEKIISWDTLSINSKGSLTCTTLDRTALAATRYSSMGPPSRIDPMTHHTTELFPRDGRKEGNVLFNDALNTFYLRLYGVRHMVKDHSDSERGNPLPPHGLLFSINSKGSFICIIAQTG